MQKDQSFEKSYGNIHLVTEKEGGSQKLLKQNVDILAKLLYWSPPSSLVELLRMKYQKFWGFFYLGYVQ